MAALSCKSSANLALYIIGSIICRIDVHHQPQADDVELYLAVSQEKTELITCRVVAAYHELRLHTQ